MLRMLTVAAAAVALFATSAAAQRDWSGVSVKHPESQTLPQGAGAYGRPEGGPGVGAATVEAVRQLAIEAGQTSSSSGKSAKKQLSPEEMKAIEQARERHYEGIRERGG